MIILNEGLFDKTVYSSTFDKPSNNVFTVKKTTYFYNNKFESLTNLFDTNGFKFQEGSRKDKVIVKSKDDLDKKVYIIGISNREFKANKAPSYDLHDYKIKSVEEYTVLQLIQKNGWGYEVLASSDDDRQKVYKKALSVLKSTLNDYPDIKKMISFEKSNNNDELEEFLSGDSSSTNIAYWDIWKVCKTARNHEDAEPYFKKLDEFVKDSSKNLKIKGYKFGIHGDWDTGYIELTIGNLSEGMEFILLRS